MSVDTVLNSGTLVPLRGHGAVVAGLLRAAREERLPHALLFEGPSGVGKFLAARHLAAGLLCAAAGTAEEGGAESCGSCGPCKRFAAGTHPDVLVLDPRAEGEEVLKLNRIADRDDSPGPTVGGFLSLKAGEGGYRVVLVRGAELMNSAAQNALLKTLEEPAPRVALVLVTSRPRQLLETVRSRCVAVGFSPLAEAELEEVLGGLDGAAEVLADGGRRDLLRWGLGSPGRVLELWGQRRLAVRKELVELLAGERQAAQCAASLRDLEGDWGGKTATAQGRGRLRVVLEVGLELLRALVLAEGLPAAAVPLGKMPLDNTPADNMALGINGPGCPIHGAALAQVMERGPAPASLRRWQVDQLLRSLQDVGANMNTDAIMDRALVALARRELDAACLAAPGSGGWGGDASP